MLLKTLTKEDFRTALERADEGGLVCAEGREHFEGINGNMSFPVTNLED